MNNWHVVESHFDPGSLHHKETVFTIGNGYLSTRGTFTEGYPGDQPATIINGVYDDVPIVYTELANTPTWLLLALFVDGERVRMDRGTILDYRRTLDMRTGTLTRRMRWQSPEGKTVEIEVERFASFADEHLLGVRYRARAIDSSGGNLRAGLLLPLTSSARQDDR